MIYGAVCKGRSVIKTTSAWGTMESQAVSGKMPSSRRVAVRSGYVEFANLGFDGLHKGGNITD